MTNSFIMVIYTDLPMAPATAPKPRFLQINTTYTKDIVLIGFQMHKPSNFGRWFITIGQRSKEMG